MSVQIFFPGQFYKIEEAVNEVKKSPSYKLGLTTYFLYLNETDGRVHLYATDMLSAFGEFLQRMHSGEDLPIDLVRKNAKEISLHELRRFILRICHGGFNVSYLSLDQISQRADSAKGINPYDSLGVLMKIGMKCLVLRGEVEAYVVKVGKEHKRFGILDLMALDAQAQARVVKTTDPAFQQLLRKSSPSLTNQDLERCAMALESIVYTSLVQNMPKFSVISLRDVPENCIKALKAAGYFKSCSFENAYSWRVELFCPLDQCQWDCVPPKHAKP